MYTCTCAPVVCPVQDKTVMKQSLIQFPIAVTDQNVTYICHLVPLVVAWVMEATFHDVLSKDLQDALTIW